jgi:ubiquinone/menaquinone biosynthesis C-methylase UbiE
MSDQKIQMDAIQAIKQAYYAKNAPQFDSMHIAPHDEHYKSLEHISNFVKSLGIESVLDIGAGTGRGILYFREHHAEVRAHGIEPSLDMRAHAISKGVSPDLITQARAESLPYPDQSFDAICEFGVVHHVRHPEIAVQEMMRVARKAIFLSDSNRFGQGPIWTRWIKLFLHKLGLWPLVDRIKNGGRSYIYGPGDGLFFSYSVYDSLPALAQWSERILLLPVSDEKPSQSLFHPLLTSKHVLLVAIRDTANRKE